jgi:hypothetical protein
MSMKDTREAWTRFAFRIAPNLPGPNPGRAIMAALELGTLARKLTAWNLKLCNDAAWWNACPGKRERERDRLKDRAREIAQHIGARALHFQQDPRGPAIRIAFTKAGLDALADGQTADLAPVPEL